MKNEKLLEKIGEISEEYIAEANPAAKATRKRRWIKWGALAACLTLAVLTIIKMIPANPVETEPEPGNLPMLSITEDSGGAMGFEGYKAYDISEIVNHNPWTETAGISSLPVYENTMAYDENNQVSDADFDKMKEFLLNVATRLGMDADSLEITDNAPNEKTQAAIRKKFEQVGENVPNGFFSPTTVLAEGNGVKIEVDWQMTAKITFDPAITLPHKYNFTNYATYEQVAAVAEYLKEKYKDFIGMDNPQVNIHGGDYSIFSGESVKTYGTRQAQRYSIEFYDGSGDITKQIINYNFNRVAFYCNDDGKLFLARVFQPDLSDKVGDYPIITADEAKDLLKNGNYITTVPEELPDLEYVAKVELIYLTGGTEQYFMPYYRFYVELPDMEMENGLKTYGAYYVPAVEGKYISNMPIWDGQFD
ncbi:MAG: DUF4825 domain-containing protein [Clostridium sp.]|jgi:hypothetical protein